jgi:hypothetical protein
VIALLSLLLIVGFPTVVLADPIITPLVASAVAGTALAGSVTVLGATFTYASLISSAIVIAGSVAVQLLLAPDAPKNHSNGQQLTVRQARPSRMRGYGMSMGGGALVFRKANEDNTLYHVIAHSEGPIASYEEWWLDDTITDLTPGTNGGNVGVEPWARDNGEGVLEKRVRIRSLLGGTGQAADSILLAAFPSLWTSDHQLKGVAYSVLECELPVRKTKDRWTQFYPRGVPPELRVVAKWSKVYNHITTTTVWTDLCGPCLHDYLTHESGFRIPSAYMNTASWTAHANLCNEDVNLAAGGSEKRYTLGGLYSYTEEPRNVLKELLATCDGELRLFPDGTIGITGGKWTEPTVTITRSMIRSYEYENGQEKLSAFNELKLSFISADHDWQPTETEPWSDLANQASRGEIITSDFSPIYVRSHGQVRRLGKIATYKGNPQHKLSLVCSAAGAKAWTEETVTVVIPELNLNTTFEVKSIEVEPDLSEVRMVLHSLGPEAYTWNKDTEEGSPPVIPDDPDLRPTPPALVVSVYSVLRAVNSSTTTVHLRGALASPPSESIWSLRGQYRKGTTGSWLEMIPDGDFAVITPALENGVDYQVRFGWAGFSGEPTSWSTPTSHTANTDPGEDLTTWAASGMTVTALGNTGPGGARAYDLNDPDAVLRNASKAFVVTPAVRTHIFQCDVKDGATLDNIRVSLVPNGTSSNATTIINPNTGAVVSGTGSTEWIGGWWRVTLPLHNDGSTSSITARVYPAGDAAAEIGINTFSNAVFTA